MVPRLIGEFWFIVGAAFQAIVLVVLIMMRDSIEDAGSESEISIEAE